MSRNPAFIDNLPYLPTLVTSEMTDISFTGATLGGSNILEGYTKWGYFDGVSSVMNIGTSSTFGWMNSGIFRMEFEYSPVSTTAARMINTGYGTSAFGIMILLSTSLRLFISNGSGVLAINSLLICSNAVGGRYTVVLKGDGTKFYFTSYNSDGSINTTNEPAGVDCTYIANDTTQIALSIGTSATPKANFKIKDFKIFKDTLGTQPFLFLPFQERSNITRDSVGGLVGTSVDLTLTNINNTLSKGICYNTTGSPTISDSKTSVGTGSTSFTSTITNLSGGTTYYARAYASNEYGVGYGNEVSGTTLKYNNVYACDGGYLYSTYKQTNSTGTTWTSVIGGGFQYGLAVEYHTCDIYLSRSTYDGVSPPNLTSHTYLQRYNPVTFSLVSEISHIITPGDTSPMQNRWDKIVSTPTCAYVIWRKSDGSDGDIYKITSGNTVELYSDTYAYFDITYYNGDLYACGSSGIYKQTNQTGSFDLYSTQTATNITIDKNGVMYIMTALNTSTIYYSTGTTFTNSYSVSNCYDIHALPDGRVYWVKNHGAVYDLNGGSSYAVSSISNGDWRAIGSLSI